jgi:hypothetical protein
VNGAAPSVSHVAPGRRIRLSRKKGWRLPAGVVKVDRSTTLGNPFVAGQPNPLGWGDVRDAEHAVWLYRTWLTLPARAVLFDHQRHRATLDKLPALAGKDLACWCTAGAPCHADVLLELAARRNVEDWAAALQHFAVPVTTLELQIAFGQYAHARGLQPTDVEQYANRSLLNLLTDERESRAAR